MKLRRRPIGEKYAAKIEELYDGSEARRQSQDAGLDAPRR
jgi:hypothetical protein